MSTADRLAPILDVLDLLRPGCTTEITPEAVAEARRAVMELAAALCEVAAVRRELAAANEDAQKLADALASAMSRGHIYALCNGNGCIPPCVGVQVALSAHRARVGG